MKESRFSESQVVAILKEVEPVALAGRGRWAPSAAHRCCMAAAEDAAVGRLAG